MTFLEEIFVDFAKTALAIACEVGGVRGFEQKKEY